MLGSKHWKYNWLLCSYEIRDLSNHFQQNEFNNQEFCQFFAEQYENFLDGQPDNFFQLASVEKQVNLSLNCKNPFEFLKK